MNRRSRERFRALVRRMGGRVVHNKKKKNKKREREKKQRRGEEREGEVQRRKVGGQRERKREIGKT